MQQFDIHLFGTAPETDVWRETTVAGTSTAPPARSIFAQHVSAGLPVALASSDRIAPSDLAAAESVGGDCTIVITHPESVTGGRGSADLAAVFWQTLPAVAVLLGGPLLECGAVIFHREGLAKIDPARLIEEDVVTSAVAEIALRGGSLKAVLIPGESAAAPPTNPPLLVPGRPSRDRRWLLDRIRGLTPAHIGAVGPATADFAAVQAGLMLWNDFLDESHAVSQSIEGEGRHQAGDYWHAIMHRREPDYGNAKYWFRRVGAHPVFESLAARSERLVTDGPSESPASRVIDRFSAGGRWDPFAFIDACADTAQSGSEETDLLLRRLQADEMLLLLWQTCQDAGT